MSAFDQASGSGLRSRLLMVLDVELDTPQMSADTPVGGRKIVTVRGGRFEGPRLRGSVLPGGGDWALMRSDGVLLLDVRLILRTDEGAPVYLT